MCNCILDVFLLIYEQNNYKNTSWKTFFHHFMKPHVFFTHAMRSCIQKVIKYILSLVEVINLKHPHTFRFFSDLNNCMLRVNIYVMSVHSLQDWLVSFLMFIRKISIDASTNTCSTLNRRNFVFPFNFK